MRKKYKAITAALLTAVLIFPAPLTALGQQETGASAQADIPVSSASGEGYAAYKKLISDKPSAEKEVAVDVSGFLADESSASLKEGKAALRERDTNAKYKFHVETAGNYNLQLVYLPDSMGTADVELGVKLDGEYPFSEAESLNFHREWKNSSEKWRVDAFGDEFTTEQVQTGETVTHTAFDDSGVELHPYLFYLTEGEHTVEFILKEEALEIEKAVFTTPEQIPDYESISAAYEKKGVSQYKGAPIVIEAEKADIKSKNSLTAKSDNNSVAVHPTSTTTSVVNYIGGSQWSEPGDTLSWNFHVDKAGLYKIGFSYKQNYLMNGSVYRWLKIDGKTPFTEATSLNFPYKSGWKLQDFADEEGNPYLVYLEEGDHTLSMTATLGVISSFYERLSNIVSVLGEEYLKINMITGENPDANRDYELFRQIPDLEKVLSEQNEDILELMDDMVSHSDSRATQYSSALRSMSQVIKSMLKTKYAAHTYKKDFYNKYVSLSSWLNEMKDMSLALDRIYIAAPDSDLSENAPGLFERIRFSISRFFYSFTENRDEDKDKEEKTIKIWINWGNDQAQILNSLIKEDFTPKTGINVDVELVNATIIQGMLTDNQPDLVLQMPRSNPVNYAMRGALVPLNKFDDFDEVMERFMPGAETPYMYKGDCYALPDTQTYYVMFYRKDVLDALGVEVPTTWDEFAEALSVIQRHNLNAYFPYIKADGATQSVGGLNLYATLLAQNGLSVYNDEHNATLIDSKECINTFEMYTKFYTDYKIDVKADFYNRFRIGVMPLGITTYTQYTTLKVTAPEIEGKWGISLLPATVREDGSLSHAVSGSGTGCTILSKSKMQNEAWEFLKWWTSDEIQLKYSTELESVMGAVSRVATANVNAFSQLSWSSEDKEILLEQWKNVVEVPEIPGSYHLARSLDQAFLEVVNSKNTPNDAMVKWAKSANNEIARKIDEYEK